tara:strand:+ start:3782 stop:4234 length:453 start_codon:yes stop_codon:yes gene_type:complete
MASTITPSSAVITVQETLTLGSIDRGGSHSRTISNVAEADRRVITVSSSGEMDLIELDTNNGQGKFVRASIRYIRITNLDNTNFIRVRFKNAGAETADVKVDAGATFMLSTGSMDADTSAGAFSAFVDIDNISAQADTADCDVEYVVFSV